MKDSKINFDIEYDDEGLPILVIDGSLHDFFRQISPDIKPDPISSCEMSVSSLEDVRQRINKI